MYIYTHIHEYIIIKDMIYWITMLLFSFCFWSHTWQCSGLPPGSLLRDHAWQGLGNHVEYWGILGNETKCLTLCSISPASAIIFKNLFLFLPLCCCCCCCCWGCDVWAWFWCSHTHLVVVCHGTGIHQGGAETHIRECGAVLELNEQPHACNSASLPSNHTSGPRCAFLCLFSPCR